MGMEALFIHVPDDDDHFDERLGWKHPSPSEVPDYSQVDTPKKSGSLRRGVLAMATAAALVPSELDDDRSHPNQKLEPTTIVATESAKETPAYKMASESTVVETVESVEPLRMDERFLAEVAGYAVAVQLRHDQVLFVDENNLPVGPPVDFVDYVEGDYRYSAGQVDEYGILIDEGPVKEWREYVVDHVLPPDSGAAWHRSYNVVQDFQKAMAEQDEPELVADIKSGQIETYDAIVSYFADKPVVGVEGNISRREYAQEMVMFRIEDEDGRPAVPQVVQEELRRLLPGLFANESKFNAGLVSENEAAGLAQIIPKTWWEYTREQKYFQSAEEETAAWEAVKDSVQVSLRMDDQLEVVGELMSDNYHYVTHYVDEEKLQNVKQLFPTEEDFERLFIAPLVINAYNAGGPLIGIALRDYLRATPEENLPAPEELFLAIADYAQETNVGGMYKEHARAYVPRVYGNAAMLEEKYDEEGN